MSQFLTHVYGQEKLKRELKLLMENHRLPHTMIFTVMMDWEKQQLLLILQIFSRGHLKKYGWKLKR